MKKIQAKFIVNNLARALLALTIFLFEMVAVGERAWVPAIFFGASLVFVVLPVSVLPLWTWKKRYLVSLMFFMVAILFSPYPK